MSFHVSIRRLFLGICRLAALLVVLLAIKVWLERPSLSSRPSPLNAMPSQLQA